MTKPDRKLYLMTFNNLWQSEKEDISLQKELFHTDIAKH